MTKQTQDPLKIGILSFYYPHLGGSGIVATRLAKNLAQKGHDVHFIGYDTDENPEIMEGLGVKLHKVRKVNYPCLKNEPYSWTLASRVVGVHEQEQLDVVHANYALPHGAAAFLARESLKDDGQHLPYVVTGHGSDIHTNGHKDDVNPILRLCLNRADALTFVSQDLQKTAETQLGIRKPSDVIPNFVDTDVFHKKETDLRKELEIPENAFVIGHVSNFAPIKQVYKFAYLAEHLKARGVLGDVYFLMCGDGKDRRFLEDRMGQIEADKQCRFLGVQNPKQLVEAYNAMDAFLLPSKYEGNPLTLLEAMACEVPVIGTRVGGIEETIGQEAGFLFDGGKKDISELGSIIHLLRNHPGAKTEVGKAGLKKVQEQYSMDEVVGRYVNIYTALKEKQ